MSRFLPWRNKNVYSFASAEDSLPTASDSQVCELLIRCTELWESLEMRCLNKIKNQKFASLGLKALQYSPADDWDWYGMYGVSII